MHELLAPHEDGRPRVMGIVNVTPDSFSDGGRFHEADAAITHGLALLDQGADWLDIGGESTRPGAEPVGEDDELARVLPVVEGVLKARPDAAISIDTMKPAVARAAVTAGAAMWNDVTALAAPGALEAAAELSCLVCLMHMQGAPQTMQTNPAYENVVTDVARHLGRRAGAALSHGVDRAHVLIDPGIGFGKTLQHNLALMAALDSFSGLGFPVLFGASRKRFIKAIDDSADAAGDRLGGSLAAALHAARAGCAVIRVHDVRETVQALKVQAAIEQAKR
ncbi:MAG: dihydropteroate synthase [Oceanicaulis sp.]